MGMGNSLLQLIMSGSLVLLACLAVYEGVHWLVQASRKKTRKQQWRR